MTLKFARYAALPLLTAAATAGAFLPTAAAQPGAAAGNYVAFGDSFQANPNRNDPVIGRGPCAQSDRGIGHHVSNGTGLALHDYSCNGTTVFSNNAPEKTLRGQVENAKAQGSLNGDTKLVTIFAGANDAMVSAFLPAHIHDELFQKGMTEAIAAVKEAAPNAKVFVVGYPAFTSADEAHFACPINANGFAPRIPAGLFHMAEMTLQDRQARAAEQAGVTFVNQKETANVEVGMCAIDGERQVSAILDSDIASYNMTNHPTFLGAEKMGARIAEEYKTSM